MNDKPDNKKIYLIMIAVYETFLFITCCHLGIYQKHHITSEFGEIFEGGIAHMREGFFSILPITSYAFQYFVYGTLISLIVGALLYYNSKARSVTMSGKEAGTAHWNRKISEYNKKYNEPFDSPKTDISSAENKYTSNNIILSSDIMLSLDSRKHFLNLNTLLIGGSGSGKTRFWIKPNLYQMNSIYFVTDPSGDVLASTGTMLENNGYKLHVLDLVNMNRSQCFNPFVYLNESNAKEVPEMVDCFIQNTTKGEVGGDNQFWTDAERLLYNSLAFFLLRKGKPASRNWSTLTNMITLANVDENNAEKESPLDSLFNNLAKEDPNCLACSYYSLFKQGSGKTLRSVLISASVRTAVFLLPEVKRITDTDEMDLYSIENEKVAYFTIVSQTSSSYDFLSAFFYSTAFKVLYAKGENLLKQNKTFKYPIRFLLDEHANSGVIMRFPQTISTCRKYNIGITTVLQNYGQLKSLYGDQGITVAAQSDSVVYLGGNDLESAQYVSDMLGTATIRTKSTSHSQGSKTGYSENFQNTHRTLMNPDEIIRMPYSYSIVMVKGQYPFYTKKYDIKKHPNYKLSGDADDKNLYVLEDHLQPQKASTEAAKEENEKRQATTAQIESDMRETLKKNLGEMPEVKSFYEFMSVYENLHGSSIFSQMSEIKTDINISDKQKNSISNEVAHIICTSINAQTAREIVSRYKEKTEKSKAEGSSGQDVPQILDTVMECESEEIDEFAQTWMVHN